MKVKNVRELHFDSSELTSIIYDHLVNKTTLVHAEDVVNVEFDQDGAHVRVELVPREKVSEYN